MLTDEVEVLLELFPLRVGTTAGRASTAATGTTAGHAGTAVARNHGAKY
jgi:hypothetical protein